MNRFDRQMNPNNVDTLMDEINNHLADIAIDIAQGQKIDEIPVEGEIKEEVLPDYGAEWFYGSGKGLYY